MFRALWPQASVHNEEGYLLGLARYFMTMPRQQAEGLLSPTGIATVHKFPPSIAEIAEWTGRFASKRTLPEVQRLRNLLHEPFQKRQPFRPYTRLWEFFADDQEAIAMLDKGLPFEFVTGLSRDMAMGADRQTLRDRLRERFLVEEARWLTVIHDKPRYNPPPPVVDIGDFPDAP